MSYQSCRPVEATVHASGFKVLLLAAVLGVLLLPAAAMARLDLGAARVERLDNGLTVIMLEDPGFPAVSVQMLYRSGGRDEQYGQTGLAHFLEHMAFRATDNFPDTDVVSRIYAAGGEWHGYTWIDQTTYFSTVPVPELDTLLRIEADRMARLKIEARYLEPERGAVLAEMHGYQNDPASLLHDQLVFTAFQGHPYRNNVIGFESDISRVQLADIKAFYRQHYHPGNAVLAIVGDIQAEQVLSRVKELFGQFPASQANSLPRTVEEPQQGLRRITLSSPGPDSLFEIAYQAPSARNPDFPGFLILRELLAGSGGINFHQDSGIAPVRAGSVLSGITDDLRSWYPISAQTYLFFLAGSIGPGQDRSSLEQAIEQQIATLRVKPVSPESLASAKVALKRELTFDLQTTEDAAHQLAYFDGLGALEILLGLEEAIESLTPEDIQVLANRYFQPHQRTIGWSLPGAVSTPALVMDRPQQFGVRRAAPVPATPSVVSVPVLTRLSAGLPVIWQQVSTSPTGFVRVLLAGENWEGADRLSTGYPEPGFSSLGSQFLASELESVLGILATQLATLQASAGRDADSIQDPGSRLEALMRSHVGGIRGTAKGHAAPLAIVVSGDLDPDVLFAALEKQFGGMAPATPASSGPMQAPGKRIVSATEHPVAQAQLGYAVSAPSLSLVESGAWKALLYILSHGYEGRLGKEAISRRGLIYYIDSNYHSDAQRGWISLAIGVDPHKLEKMEKLLQEQLQGLALNPPSEAEIDEARQHLLGRYQTENQSNPERSAFLARQWIQQGRLLSDEEVVRGIEAINREQVLAIVPRFLDGTTVVVDHTQIDAPN